MLPKNDETSSTIPTKIFRGNNIDRLVESLYYISCAFKRKPLQMAV